jgi:hypothetical protein
LLLYSFCRVSGLVDVGGFDGIGDICLHVQNQRYSSSDAHLIKQFADLYGVTQAQDCPVHVKSI